MRLIDADKLMQSLGITNMDCEKCAWHDKEWSRCKRGGDFEDACFAIENAPTIEERKKGKWIEQDDCWDGVYYECSVCKDSFTLIDGNPSDNNYNFCPNCGSYNGGEEE